jgi:hypothetical protein
MKTIIIIGLLILGLIVVIVEIKNMITLLGLNKREELEETKKVRDELSKEIEITIKKLEECECNLSLTKAKNDNLLTDNMMKGYKNG